MASSKKSMRMELRKTTPVSGQFGEMYHVRDGDFYICDVDGNPTSLQTGVTDHGTLSGLGDDDHTQYHNDTRGDARYVLKSGDTMTGNLTINRTSPTIQFIESDENPVSGSGSYTGILASNNNLYLQHRPASGQTANNYLQVKYVDESEAVDYWAFRVGTQIEAHLDYAGSTDLPNLTSIVTRERGDARYVQGGAGDFVATSGDTMTGDLTLQGALYVGANSASNYYGARTNGQQNFRSLNTNVAGLQFLYFDSANTHIARIEGKSTTAPNTVSLMTREMSDARYTQIVAAAEILGDLVDLLQNTTGVDPTKLATIQQKIGEL